MQSHARLACGTLKTHFLAWCISNIHILCIRAQFGCHFGCVFGAPHRKHALSDTLVGSFGTEVCAFSLPHWEKTCFGIAHFKHIHTKYLKAVLLALFVQRYARSARHTGNTHFWGLSISNTPTLSTQKHFALEFFVDENPLSARHTRNTLFWHDAFQRHPY